MKTKTSEKPKKLNLDAFKTKAATEDKAELLKTIVGGVMENCHPKLQA